MQDEGDSEGERDFQVFVRSGTPTERYWGGGRVVFYTDRDDVSRVKRSEGMRGRHPETAMLDELQEMLSSCRDSRLKVTVFQNASPCASCSRRYVELFQKARDENVELELSIAFVALYKVRRPSRAWRQSYSVLNLPQEVHRQNVRGLQSLRDLDVQLRVFGFSDWRRLRQLLDLQPDWQEDLDYTGSVLQRENQTTARDLQRLLAENVDSDEEEEEEEEEDNMQLAEMCGEEEEPQPPQPNAEPAELERREFLMFWDSGLHGVHWRSGARAVYIIDRHEPSDVFVNTATDAAHHAETYLLPDLRRRLMGMPYGDINVTVYQNLSPCGSCCERYVDLLDFFNNNDDNNSNNNDNNSNNNDDHTGNKYNRKKNVKLTIVFARFYNIKRPSCEECNLHRTPSDNDHYRAVGGLLRLRDKGVALHCFQEQDWSALHQHLQVPGPPPVYDFTRRKLEDELMAEDAKKVFGFDLVARARENQAEGGADGVLMSRSELKTLQDMLLVQNAMTSEVKRIIFMTLTLALPLVTLLVLLLCYFLFGWRPLVVMGILVTQLAMIWAGLPVLCRGERASLLLHVLQLCLSIVLLGMIYRTADWRDDWNRANYFPEMHNRHFE